MPCYYFKYNKNIYILQKFTLYCLYVLEMTFIFSLTENALFTKTLIKSTFGKRFASNKVLFSQK